MNNPQPTQWFVLRTKFCRELKIKEHLTEKNVQSFVPMKYELIIKDERKQRIEVPAIHNMVFVYSTREILDDFMAQSNLKDSIQYISRTNTREPIIIPQQEMTNFMLVTGTLQENLIYLNDGIKKFEKNDRVHVTGGLLEGLEGYIVRIRRDRKIVVSLQGVVAVAISGIHPSLLRKI